MKKRNKTKSLHTLQIGTQTFTSIDPSCFEVKQRDVEKIAVANLPLNITLKIISPALKATFEILKINSNLTKVSFHQIVVVTEWPRQISMESFFNLKRDLILSDKTLKPQIDILEGDLMFTTFGYSIQISASTVGEVIKLTLKIDKEFVDKIDRAVKMGIRYINLVAHGAFQIDVSNIFSGKDKNTKV